MQYIEICVSPEYQQGLLGLKGKISGYPLRVAECDPRRAVLKLSVQGASVDTEIVCYRFKGSISVNYCFFEHRNINFHVYPSFP